MSDYVIDVNNLCKSFQGKTVVNNLNIKMKKGEIYGFLGPNGSGKTTTIRMICGLISPDSGQGSCLGFDINKDSKKIKLNIGYMTQRFSYWEDLSIRENLEFVADMFGVKNKKIAVDDTLSRLGLFDRQHQLAGNLSGGWKQRLALGACTLHKPKILLLDEPTAGVDPNARREFWEEIHSLSSNGVTVLVSTHYMDEAERCHKIIYISNGNIVINGSVKEVIDNAGLFTWLIKGQNLDSISSILKNHPDICAVAPFGDSLHVSGQDEKKLLDAIMPFKNQYQCEKVSPSLEDAFIHYMNEVF